MIKFKVKEVFWIRETKELPGLPPVLNPRPTGGSQQLSTSKKGITVGEWGIHIFGAKVLNFLELPETIFFFHIYGIHVLVSIFSSINGAGRILNLNVILMVLNLFCCKILSIYLRLSICASKRCHIVIYIFWNPAFRQKRVLWFHYVSMSLCQ